MGGEQRVIAVEVSGERKLRVLLAPTTVVELDFAQGNWVSRSPDFGIPDFFATAEIDPATGALVWPNGYAISARALYSKARTADNGADEGSGLSVVTIAGAVASGLGVLGFVAFAGGVVLWTRFDEMGLPAAHTLALVPRAELLSTGAEFLVPALLIAFGIAVLVLVVDWAFERRRWETAREWAYAGLVLAVAVTLSVIVWRKEQVADGAFAVLLGFAIAGGAAVYVCHELQKAVLLLVVFLAIGAFMIARAYERTRHNLEVIPMAYSRAQKGHPPRVEYGYFIAETSDRIYFASLPRPDPKLRNHANELRDFARNEATDLEVGALAEPEQAERDAAHYAYNLCRRIQALGATQEPTPKKAKSNSTATAKASSKPKAKSPECSPEYIQELKERAEPTTQAKTPGAGKAAGATPASPARTTTHP